MAEAPREVKWLELGRDRRRRVARAVRKGRTVDDPRDAPYAVGFADASLEWLSWKRRFRPLHLMLVALVLAELTLSGGWHPALALYPLLGFGFLRLRAPRLRITELQRLGPRSRLQKLYVAWREYEVKLDVGCSAGSRSAIPRPLRSKRSGSDRPATPRASWQAGWARRSAREPDAPRP